MTVIWLALVARRGNEDGGLAHNVDLGWVGRVHDRNGLSCQLYDKLNRWFPLVAADAGSLSHFNHQ